MLIYVSSLIPQKQQKKTIGLGREGVEIVELEILLWIHAGSWIVE